MGKECEKSVGGAIFMKRTYDMQHIPVFVTLWRAVLVRINRLLGGRAVLPPTIGSYTLVKPVHKSSAFANYGVGLYERNGVTYFVKIWQGIFKDFYYYSLVNEIQASRIINKHLHSQHLSISTSEIQFIEEQKHMLIVGYEFVNGNTLDTVTVSRQSEVMVAVIEAFHTVSKNLTKAERSQISHRGYIFFIMSLVVSLLITLFTRPQNSGIIIRAFCYCLAHPTNFRAKRLHLAHRDLKPENIMMVKNKIYVLDLETVALTVPNYDLIYFECEPPLFSISSRVRKVLSYPMNCVFRTYLLLLFSANSASVPELQEVYIRLLSQAAL